MIQSNFVSPLSCLEARKLDCIKLILMYDRLLWFSFMGRRPCKCDGGFDLARASKQYISVPKKKEPVYLWSMLYKQCCLKVSLYLNFWNQHVHIILVWELYIINALRLLVLGMPSGGESMIAVIACEKCCNWRSRKFISTFNRCSFSSSTKS